MIGVVDLLPICLFSEDVSMLKKVIADQVWAHLNQVGKNLSDYQFGQDAW